MGGRRGCGDGGGVVGVRSMMQRSLRCNRTEPLAIDASRRTARVCAKPRAFPTRKEFRCAPLLRQSSPHYSSPIYSGEQSSVRRRPPLPLPSCAPTRIYTDLRRNPPSGELSSEPLPTQPFAQHNLQWPTTAPRGPRPTRLLARRSSISSSRPPTTAS
jgi:hypothetical protein